MDFPLHDEDSAPVAARPYLAATRKSFGMIPNLERTMASAPPLLAAYSFTWEIFDQTSFDPIERQVVYLTANFENECSYCVPWHSLLAKQAGADAATIDALRAGAVLPNPKHEALRQFTRQLILNRGKATHADMAAFTAAGYGAVQALEVVLGIAIKTMSNFTNSIAATPLDKDVARLTWTKPFVDRG
jgi:AhpD family alkylhydroperoxidase